MLNNAPSNLTLVSGPLHDSRHPRFLRYLYSDARLNSVLDVPLPSSLDQRLKELKNGIVRAEDKEKSIEIIKIVTRVLKRVYLAELIGKYIKETAARKAEPNF